MRVVVLDAIEENVDKAELASHGYELAMNPWNIEGPVDIVAHLWSRLSLSWLQLHRVKAAICQDFDEPDNILPYKELLRVDRTESVTRPYLVDEWGNSTRIRYHSMHHAAWMAKDTHIAHRLMLVGINPTFDVMAPEYKNAGLTVSYVEPTLLPFKVDEFKPTILDCHIGKAELPFRLLDSVFPMLHGVLLISTTRGALYTAERLGAALDNGNVAHAVLDWTWGKLKHPNITFTKHRSYKSEQSKRELTEVTIRAIEQARADIELA